MLLKELESESDPFTGDKRICLTCTRRMQSTNSRLRDVSHNKEKFLQQQKKHCEKRKGDVGKHTY